MSTEQHEQANVAVIGYGTAGVNAVIALRSAGYEGPVRVFSDTGIPPYSPILTSYYAGGRKGYGECFPWSPEQLAELDVELLERCPVERLDLSAHAVVTAQGAFPYTKCIIASGSRPMAYGFPDADGYKPLMLRTMDDAERLKSTLEDDACERVLVSGASMVALKTLEACLDRKKHVTLVGMSPHVLDFNALPQAAERFEARLRAFGVELRLGQTIAQVHRTDAERGGLEVVFSNGDTDSFDAISVSHGMRSNLDFVDEGALEMDRALIVDEYMRTSDADVYAAGDVAQALELVSGEKRIVGIWKSAAVQGACAGRAVAAEMAGRSPSPEHAYKGFIPMNTIAVEDALFISSGTMEVTDSRHVETREADGMLVIYIFEDDGDGKRRLVGFNLVCDHDEPGGVAYDTGAMLTMRIEQDCLARRS